jgi:hypothetical protein
MNPTDDRKGRCHLLFNRTKNRRSRTDGAVLADAVRNGDRLFFRSRDERRLRCLVMILQGNQKTFQASQWPKRDY